MFDYAFIRVYIHFNVSFFCAFSHLFHCPNLKVNIHVHVAVEITKITYNWYNLENRVRLFI